MTASQDGSPTTEDTPDRQARTCPDDKGPARSPVVQEELARRQNDCGGDQDEPACDMQRPLSPYYWELRKMLDDEGVVLLPSDRDLAPLMAEEGWEGSVQ